MCLVLLTRASVYVVLFYVICAFCLLVVLVRLSVPVQAIYWKDCLNPTHPLTRVLAMLRVGNTGYVRHLHTYRWCTGCQHSFHSYVVTKYNTISAEHAANVNHLPCHG